LRLNLVADLAFVTAATQPRHLIDPYLRPIIMQLEDHITQNALVQYLEPYTNANLSRMLETFGQDPNGDRTALVTKLAELIRTDRLHAKLDLVTMVRRGHLL